MDIDEDEPPSLVNVGQINKRALSPMSSQMQDLKLSKVPLTIVTGMSLALYASVPFVIC